MFQCSSARIPVVFPISIIPHSSFSLLYWNRFNFYRFCLIVQFIMICNITNIFHAEDSTLRSILWFFFFEFWFYLIFLELFLIIFCVHFTIWFVHLSVLCWFCVSVFHLHFASLVVSSWMNIFCVLMDDYMLSLFVLRVLFQWVFRERCRVYFYDTIMVQFSFLKCVVPWWCLYVISECVEWTIFL